ncbi:cholecystokinin receptor-like [Mytilus californianus]|uniref:cholecystokinin receptor-like n=1 Tax=Mytilus californianus TaxID=6549 RepID=UPI0022479C78|nr:cholecystokinin receptor-like [Mytilus californianus]
MNITALEWNDEIVKSLIANIVLLSMYIMTGIFGNSLVLIVYALRMKDLSDERYFIPILAVFDMLAAVYLGSFAIYECLNQVTFSNSIACKIAEFFAGFTTFVPIFILLIIAIQRYLKVCHPLKSPMQRSLKRVLLCLANLCSFFIALPIPFVFDTNPFYSSDYGVIGMHCGGVKDGKTIVRIVYSIVLGTFAIGVTSTLIILYSRIAYTIFHQLKVNGHKGKHTQNDVDLEGKTISSDISATSLSGDLQLIRPEKRQLPSTVIDGPKYCDAKHDMKTSTGDIAKQSGSQRRQKINRRITHNITIMFLVITSIFLLCYISKVTVLIIEGINKNFWGEMSTAKRSGVLFVSDMFIINNIVNPFIYAFMDTKFRNESKTFLKRVFKFNSC